MCSYLLQGIAGDPAETGQARAQLSKGGIPILPAVGNRQEPSRRILHRLKVAVLVALPGASWGRGRDSCGAYLDLPADSGFWRMGAAGVGGVGAWRGVPGRGCQVCETPRDPWGHLEPGHWVSTSE